MTDEGEEVEARPLGAVSGMGGWKTLGSLGPEGQFEMDRISMSVSDWQQVQEEMKTLRDVRTAAQVVVELWDNEVYGEVYGPAFDEKMDELARLVSGETPDGS